MRHQITEMGEEVMDSMRKEKEEHQEAIKRFMSEFDDVKKILHTGIKEMKSDNAATVMEMREAQDKHLKSVRGQHDGLQEDMQRSQQRGPEVELGFGWFLPLAKKVRKQKKTGCLRRALLEKCTRMHDILNAQEAVSPTSFAHKVSGNHAGR